MINGNDGGANVTVNGAESWTSQAFPTAQFYNAFVTAHVPYHVCGAQQDNSTACVSSAGHLSPDDVGFGDGPHFRAVFCATPTCSTPGATAAI